MEDTFSKTKNGAILFLIVFFPVGIYLMWKYRKDWTTATKVIISSVISILVILIVVGSNISFEQRLENIQEAIDNRNYTLAYNMLEEEIRTNKSEKVYLLYAEYYIANNLYSDAVDILEEGLEETYSNNEISEKLSQIIATYSVQINAEIQKSQEQAQKEKEQEEKQVLEEQEKARLLQEQKDKENSENEQKLFEEELVNKEKYMNECVYVDWKDLCRNPDDYIGMKIIVKGEIAQIMNGGWFTDGGCRLYEDFDFMQDTFMDKEWYISVDTDVSPRILKDDIVIFYGNFGGITEVKRALTQTKDTVPTLNVKYYEIITE